MANSDASPEQKARANESMKRWVRRAYIIRRAND